MIKNRCKNLHHGGIATSSPSSSSIFLPPLPHIIPSWCPCLDDMVRFGMEAAILRQLRCQWGCFSSPLQEGIANFFGMWPMYSYIRHNSQQLKKSIHTSWLVWLTVAAMVTHSWCCHIEQSPNILADCWMWQRWEWGIMEAVGQQLPLWSIGVCFSLL